MQRRAALSLLALAASVLAGAACLSPTLPLPPPEAPDTIQPLADQEGVWTISGNCYAGALVTLFNDRTRQGVVIEDTDQNGRFTVELAAEPCDLVLISQEVITDDGLETSPHNSFIIEERDTTGVIGEACP